MRFNIYERIPITREVGRGKSKRTDIIGYEYKKINKSVYTEYANAKLAFEKKIAEVTNKERFFMAPMPELQVGLQLYKTNGDYYGEIIEETEAFYKVKRPEIVDIPEEYKTIEMKYKFKGRIITQNVDTEWTEKEKKEYLTYRNALLPMPKSHLKELIIKGFAGEKNALVVPETTYKSKFLLEREKRERMGSTS